MADLKKPDTSEPSGVAERIMTSDTDILALEREIVALQREIDKPESDIPEKEFEALVDRQNELDLKILAAPASTVREVDAKLRRVLAWLAQDRGGFFEEIRKNMYGAGAGSEAPESSPCSDPIFAAAAKHDELMGVFDAVDSDQDEGGKLADAAWERASDAYQVGCEIAPKTPAGMARKIEFHQRQFTKDEVMPDRVMYEVAAFLRSLAEPTGQGAPCTAAIREGIFDIDDPITGAEAYTTALGALIELVPEGHHRQTMFSVHTKLGSALIKARKIFNELHVAAGGVS